VLRAALTFIRSRAALPRSLSLRSRPAVLAASSTTAAASKQRAATAILHRRALLARVSPTRPPIRLGAGTLVERLGTGRGVDAVRQHWLKMQRKAKAAASPGAVAASGAGASSAGGAPSGGVLPGEMSAAADRGDEAAVVAWLDRGGQVGATNKDSGWTLLMKASQTCASSTCCCSAAQRSTNAAAAGAGAGQPR